MAKELAPELIQKTLQGINIPARPQILVRLDSEMAKDDPDPRIVVRLISSDVVLSAAMLKTVNSPFFGLSRRISSVAQAVSMLGLRMTARIVSGLVLRMTMGGRQSSFERFWDTAEKVACISGYVASTLPRGPRDEAYCFGLFRDIGIPMLLQKFPDYRQTLALADNTVDRPMTVIEEERHATDHATLGYLVARSWLLPEVICEGIRHHHDPSIFDTRDLPNPMALTLIAINALAEHLHDEYVRMRANAGWQLMADRVLVHLGLSEDDYCDLREEVTTLVR